MAGLNPAALRDAADCDHGVVLKPDKDGTLTLWHYGDLLLRDAPLLVKDGQTETGAAIVLVKRWHKADAEEARRRESNGRRYSAER
jgi:hypothetical protein